MARQPDPYHGYNFLVEIDGITRAGFREVSGLDATQDAVEYREGNEKSLTVRKLPGLNKFANVSLQWGIADDDDLWKWREAAMRGDIQRKNGSIVLLNEKGEEKMRWNFREGWPSKWTGPTFNATSDEIAIEALEIAHEGIVRA